MNFSLKTKIVLSSVLFILIGGFVATYVVFTYTKKSLVKINKDNIELSNKERVKEAEAIFGIAENAVASIVVNKSIGDFILSITNGGEIEKSLTEDELSAEEVAEKESSFNEKREEMESELAEINLGNIFDIVYIMDEKGMVVVSTDRTLLGNNYSFRDYFKEAIQGKAFVDFSVGVTTGKAGYYFSRAIQKEGKMIGVAVGKMPAETIEKTTQDLAFGDPVTMLVDSFGVVIYSNNPQKTYKLTGNISDNEKVRINASNRYALKSEIETLEYDAVLKAIVANERFLMYNFFDEADGEEELVTVSKIGKFPFYLVSELETEVFLEPVEKISFILASIILISALMVSIMISYVTHIFLRPLKQLKEVAESIGKKDFSVQVEVKSNDELGELGAALNDSSEQLKEMYEQLDEKVNERTKELEKTNRFMVGRELKMLELKKEISNLKNELGKILRK